MLFRSGAIARGVPEAQAAHIFDLVDRFAGYGFNKSHAAAYALVAYQTAYLKANYPVEFIAASMTYELGNTDKLNVFRQELDRQKIKLLPPDVNRSLSGFSVEFDTNGVGAVRYALGAIRNVGAAAMNALVAERERSGPFKNLFDFARRVDAKSLNKRALEQLVKAGAFDGLEPNRARAHAAVETLLRMAQAASSERTSNQIGLFGKSEIDARGPDLPKISDWPIHQRLANEFEAIGFYLSAHPLDAYAKGLARLGAVKSSELGARLAGGGATRVKLAGTIIGKQERTSAKGNRFAFVQFSDRTGVFEVAVFSEVLATKRSLLEPGTPLPTRLTPVYPTSAQLPQAYLRKAVDAALRRVDLREIIPAAYLPKGMMGLREAIERVRLHETLCTDDAADGTTLTETLPTQINNATVTVSCRYDGGNLPGANQWAAVLTGIGVSAADPAIASEAGNGTTKLLDGPVYMGISSPPTFVSDLKSAVALVEGDFWFYDAACGATTSDRKSTRLNSSHVKRSRMPSSA